MADAAIDQFLTPSRKRSLDGDIISTSEPLEGLNNAASANTDADRTRQASEAPSTASALTELSSITMASPAKAKSASTLTTDESAPASKKRKLTFAEREVEKAVQKREKEEAKARREEEKRLRDQEKQRREEEKEITKRARELEKAEKKKAEDAKKLEREEKRKADEARRIEREDKKKAFEQEKEAERAAKEAEKLKKERSQMRIASFFGRSTPASTPPLTPDEQPGEALSRRLSIASVDAPQEDLPTSTAKPANPEYESYIIPYFIHEHTYLAPYNRWQSRKKESCFDGQNSNYEIKHENLKIGSLKTQFQKRERGAREIIPVKTIIEALQETEDGIDDHSKSPNPLDAVSYKILSFREDIRPPYMGTYTRHISPRAARRMSRRPTYRGRPDTNYDYDSEAEWEPPAEDDEELGEDEMSDEEEGDGEMEDFLDDDTDASRRKLFVRDMEPVGSGVCWQDQTTTSNGFNMNDYRMDFLHDSTCFPIDPFSTIHWADETKASTSASKSEPKAAKTETETSMPPPRAPLATVNAPNNIMNMLSPYRSKQDPAASDKTDATSPRPAKQRGRPSAASAGPPKMVAPQFLDSFKQAIDGSDLTKAGLIEILKKQFPKCSKDAIKDTLGVVAERVGKKEADKRWALKA